MKHFIITRFNLQNEDWVHARDGEKVLTSNWLDHRFDLFEKYTLPSVKNQKNQSFKWLVFFDTNTPDNYRDQIENIDNSYNNFIPIYIDGLEQLACSTEKEVMKRLDNNDEFVITTRLDNDDLIHESFIEKIQSAFIPKDKTIIDVSLGYQMVIEGSMVNYRLFTKSFNPFLSLISNVSNFESAVSRSHHEWQSMTRIIKLNHRPLWMQLVHQKNMVARVNRSLKVVRAPLEHEFGVLLPATQKSGLTRLLTNIYTLPQRLLYNLKSKLRS